MVSSLPSRANKIIPTTTTVRVKRRPGGVVTTIIRRKIRSSGSTVSRINDSKLSPEKKSKKRCTIRYLQPIIDLDKLKRINERLDSLLSKFELNKSHVKSKVEDYRKYAPTYLKQTLEEKKTYMFHYLVSLKEIYTILVSDLQQIHSLLTQKHEFFRYCQEFCTLLSRQDSRLYIPSVVNIHDKLSKYRKEMDRIREQIKEYERVMNSYNKEIDKVQKFIKKF